MAEWDDKINQLFVEIDALDDNPDKSSIEPLWLKTLTIATGVDEPSAERVGELVNEVIESFDVDVVEQSNVQIDDIFYELERLSLEPSNGQIKDIWTEFMYVMLGDSPVPEEFKQLVYCTLIPLNINEHFVDDNSTIAILPNNKDSDDLHVAPVLEDTILPVELSQEDISIIQEAEAALNASSTSKDGYVWPQKINNLLDEEIISILNRLFFTYSIDAKLQGIDELKSVECFEMIKGKLNVAPWCEMRDNYKTGWSIIYRTFLKSQDAVFEDIQPKQKDEPEQNQGIEQPIHSTDTSLLEAASISEDHDAWPKHINNKCDEDIVSYFNRLFIRFQIGATLSLEDLKDQSKFMEICHKLGSSHGEFKLKGQYKQSWNLLYKFFIKDKDLTLYYPKFEQSSENVSVGLEQKADVSPEQSHEAVQRQQRRKKSYINGYEGYLKCAHKHLEACKTILVAHDSILHETEDSNSNSLVYEEIYYLSGFILECSTMAALLKIIHWKEGKELYLLDNDEHKKIRTTYQICWDKKFEKCHRLSSHFAGKRIVDLIKKNNSLSTLFQDIPFLNGNHDVSFFEINDGDNYLCLEVFSDNRIIDKVERWNNSVNRYRELPFGDKKISRRDTILLIALCDLILKRIIKKFNISFSNYSVDASLHSVHDSFRNLVSRYINIKRNNYSIYD